MGNNEETIFHKIVEPLYKKISKNDFVIDKSGSKTVEILNCSLELNPVFPVVEFVGRKTPISYCQEELKWYNSQSLSVWYPDKESGIASKAKLWNVVCSDNGKVNSNYGWCVFSKENGLQFGNVVEELKKNPSSRRAVMIYNRPSMWEDYKKDGMDDFICTLATQHFIRNGKLITIVNMRSNDFVYGFFNDFFWQCHIHNSVANSLSVESDHMIWNANSMHVYERHFEKLVEIYHNNFANAHLEMNYD